jgi:hypothetical protein
MFTQCRPRCGRWLAVAAMLFLGATSDAAAQTIANGDTVAASISSAHEIDSWTFVASKGDY